MYWLIFVVGPQTFHNFILFYFIDLFHFILMIYFISHFILCLTF